MRIVKLVLPLLAIAGVTLMWFPINSVSATAKAVEKPEHSGPPAKSTDAMVALSEEKLLAGLKAAAERRPLLDVHAIQLRTYMKTVEARGLSSNPKFKPLMLKASGRLAWVNLRGKKDVESIAVCETAIQRRLKQPDSFAVVGRKVGFDPRTDWIMNVEIEANAMNSFGARLRSRFACRVRCKPLPDQYGFNCDAIAVKEL